jgi:putative MFS transporter
MTGQAIAAISTMSRQQARLASDAAGLSHGLVARLDDLPVFSFHWRIVALLGFLFFCELGDTNTLPFAAPAILESWHMSVETLGLVFSATFLGMFLGAAIGGHIADRIGRKRALIATALWFGGFSLVNALVWEPTGLVMVRFLTGLGLAAMVVVSSTYVVEMFPAAQRGRLHALIFMIAVLGVPATGWVARLLVPMAPWGWRLVFVWGALGLVFPLIASKLEESPRWLLKQGRIEESEAAMARIIAAARREKGELPPPAAMSATQLQEDSRTIFTLPLLKRLLPFAGLWMFSTIGVYGFISWVPSLLVKQGISITNSLTLSTLMQLGQVPGALLMAAISDRWQRKWTAVLLSLLVATCVLAYGLTLRPLTIIVFGFLELMFISAFSALNYCYTAESFPTAVRSTGTGITYGSGRLANVFGAMMIAFLFTHYGYLSVFTYLAGCWLVVALLVACFCPRTRGQRL